MSKHTDSEAPPERKPRRFQGSANYLKRLAEKAAAEAPAAPPQQDDKKAGE